MEKGKRRREEEEETDDRKNKHHRSEESSSRRRSSRGDDRDYSREHHRDRGDRHRDRERSSGKSSERDDERRSSKRHRNSDRDEGKDEKDSRRDERDGRRQDRREKGRDKDEEKEREQKETKEEEKREEKRIKEESQRKELESSESQGTADGEPLPVPSDSKSLVTPPEEGAKSLPKGPGGKLNVAGLLASLQASKKKLEGQLKAQQSEAVSSELLKKQLEGQLARKGLKGEKETEGKDKEEKELDKKAKVESIQERLAKLSKKKETSKGTFLPPPLLLDEKGREVDAMGQVIALPKGQPVATLKANQRVREETLKRLAKKEKDRLPPPEPKKTTFFDPSLTVPKPRARRSFLEPSTRTRVTGVTAAPPPSEGTLPPEEGKSLPTALPKVPKEVIPAVEWWDEWLLPEGPTGKVEGSGITLYIEHPVPARPPWDKDAPTVMPMFLTPKEKKKLRKRERMEREKERQERVMLGLEPPPPPKVRLANMMRVWGSETTADPTAMEREVTRLTLERQANHEARNLARALTPQQRREKKRQKYQADAKTGTVVALFRVKDLSHPRLKFKVNVNAQDLHLTGCAILFPKAHMVLVEGGPKAIRKFVKLMTRRIDWNQQITSEESEEGNAEKESKGNGEKESKENGCLLVWQGAVQRQNFQQFRFETFPDEESIRKYLHQRWSEPYWDMCCNFHEDLIQTE